MCYYLSEGPLCAEIRSCDVVSQRSKIEGGRMIACDCRDVGAIIGKGGELIQQLQAETGTRINVSGWIGQFLRSCIYVCHVSSSAIACAPLSL